MRFNTSPEIKNSKSSSTNSIKKHPTEELPKEQKMFEHLDFSLQYLLNHYSLKSIPEIVEIILNQEASRQFRSNYPEFCEDQEQEELLSQKLQKLAVEHSYNEMYICYQQFPMYLQECKRVLRYKYRTDDILRTHMNRKSIWLLCSGALFKKRENPNYYNKLGMHQEVNPQFFKHTIDKDVVRTIQDKNCSCGSEESLSRVLRRLAIRNPYIGYCQGMNFIVNFLILMQFSEDEIFWLMTQLTEEFLPKTYYTNMMGVAVDIFIIEQYIKSNHAALYERLSEMGLSLSLFTLEWLVCLFTTTLPFYMLVIIWDMMFLYGPTVLLKVCIVVLEELQQTILETEDISQLLGLIESKKKGIFIEEDQFIRRISEIYIDVTLLDLCRQIIELKLLKEKIEVNSTIRKNKKEQEIQCSIEWPVCFKALKSHKSDCGEIQTWTFKDEGPPKVINDYLILKNKSSFKPLEDSRSEDKKMLIGRIPHICDIKEYDKKQQIQKQSIQLDEYELLNRRVLINDLKHWTNKIEQLQSDNQHVDFYKRATSSNLAFLNFNSSRGPQSSNKEGAKNRFQKAKFSDKKSKESLTSTIAEQDQGQNYQESKIKPKKEDQIANGKEVGQSNELAKIVLEYAETKSRNPFKRLMNRISQKRD